MTLHSELAALHDEEHEDGPDVPGPRSEAGGRVVRIPAFADERGLWQGGIFTSLRRGEVLVQLDDGRSSGHPTPLAAYEWFSRNAWTLTSTSGGAAR